MTGFRLPGSGGAKKPTDKLSPSSKPTALVDAVTTPSGGGAGAAFGIRSYIHQFYGGASPLIEDGSGAWYLLPPPPAARKALFLCRCATIFGLLLLLTGAGAIVVGYTWPHASVEQGIERFALFQDEDGTFYVPHEKLAELLRDPMRHWKSAGFCLFASGAALLAISLVLPSCAHCLGGAKLAGLLSEDVTPSEPPVRVFAGQHKSTSPIPVAEHIAPIQPTVQQQQPIDVLTGQR